MLPGFFCTCCILGRAPRTKETARFLLNHGSRKMGHGDVVLGYRTSTSLPQVDGLSTDPRVLGRHNLVSELRYTST